MASPKLLIAAILYSVVALGMALVGGTYLLSPTFMPYHAQVVGLTWDEVPERTRWLLIAFQHGAGAMGIALALAIALIAWIPLRRGEGWARWTVPLLGLVAGLPLLRIVHLLATSTEAAVPLAPLVVGIAVFLAGAMASFWPSRHAHLTLPSP